jgi:putative phosphonate metabolism protein
MRYAIYFCPPQGDALERAATTWLGRSAFTNVAHDQPEVGGLGASDIAYHTAAPRRYGFHATLMAPFALSGNESERSLVAAIADFSETRPPFEVPRMALRQIDRFFAIVPETSNDDLDRLARDVVTAFDRFRAPLSEKEKERRGAAQLSPGQLRNLLRWGYPYVFDEFRFHMTLTGRVDDADRERVRHALDSHFGTMLEQPLEVASLALFLEPEPGAPFVVRSFHEFGPSTQRKTA